MFSNKPILCCALALIAVSSLAQQGAEPVITLEQYAHQLAAKLKQSELTVPAIQAGAVPSIIALAGSGRAAAADRFDGWVFNGATSAPGAKQPLFGELLVHGNNRIVYSGDPVAPNWHVAQLSGRFIEFENAACSSSAKVAPPRKQAASQPQPRCRYRLSRKD